MKLASGTLAALSGLVLAANAAAGPPTTTPPGTTGGGSRAPIETHRSREDVGGETTIGERSPEATIDLEGRVTNSAGAPLGAVLVKAFANGLLMGSVRTDADGTFSLSAHPMHAKKGSAVVWFESPDVTKYLDTSLVLWEDKGAAELRMFPACTQTVHGESNYGKLDVTLRSMDELQSAVIASKCLESAPPATSP